MYCLFSWNDYSTWLTPIFTWMFSVQQKQIDELAGLNTFELGEMKEDK